MPAIDPDLRTKLLEKDEFVTFEQKAQEIEDRLPQKSRDINVLRAELANAGPRATSAQRENLAEQEQLFGELKGLAEELRAKANASSHKSS
jgi:hypothetical protein